MNKITPNKFNMTIEKKTKIRNYILISAFVLYVIVTLPFVLLISLAWILAIPTLYF